MSAVDEILHDEIDDFALLRLSGNSEVRYFSNIGDPASPDLSTLEVAYQWIEPLVRLRLLSQQTEILRLYVFEVDQNIVCGQGNLRS